jgi:hypothetical protein
VDYAEAKPHELSIIKVLYISSGGSDNTSAQPHLDTTLLPSNKTSSRNRPDAIMHEITETIDIAAPVSQVWSIISDLPSYHEWNTFVISASSNSAPLAKGTKATITIKALPDSAPAVYKNEILVVDPPKELRWTGSLLHAAVFNTEHWCTIEQVDKQSCRFSQGEKFTGLLVPVISLGKTFAELKQGYARMNQDLKTFAESRHRDAK